MGSVSSAVVPVPDVFSARDIARAAGASVADVRALISRGRIGTVDGRFVSSGESVRAVRMLRDGKVTEPDGELFKPPAPGNRSPGRALAASGALHVIVLAGLLALTSLGVASAPQERQQPVPMRLVFLTTPGPGGGGGGGGLRHPAPAPKAEMKGAAALRSPVPPPRVVIRPEPVKPPPPVRPQPVERPAEPPPPAAATVPLPQVVAPVATSPSDAQDRAGVVDDVAQNADSQGSGAGGGAGTGQGTGIGEGNGSGVGPGSGGGTGGGPYRPGAGITPPGLLREVKPDYTEEARRRGVEGDVLLEIVVRKDGGVGEVKVLQGLTGGLDQRAIDAVRQWRFSPAHRFGTPVDVIVEVAVQFKLR